MADEEYFPSSNQIKITVSPGTPRFIVFQSGETAGVTVTVIPGGNTGLVQESTSPIADIRAGNGVFQNWPKGSVAGTTNDVILGSISALRFQATGGDVDFEIVRKRK